VPFAKDEAFQPLQFAPRLEALAELTEEEFRSRFRNTAVWRTKYAGFLRNVAIAMGNAGDLELRKPLEKLTRHADESVAATARQALSVFEKRQRYTEGTQVDTRCASVDA
jgi:epoxyqueuosine reductase